MYYTYILYSAKHNKLNIGMTKDLQKELLSFNELSTDEDAWTNKYRPWKCIFFEKFNDPHQSRKRHAELSGLKGRLFIKNTLLKNI